MEQITAQVHYTILIFILCYIISQFILHLGCSCSSKGTISCAEIGGFCDCKIGYSGSDCGTCDEGYYISSVDDMEYTCTGKFYTLNPYSRVVINRTVNAPLECNCNLEGSNSCSRSNGSCSCDTGYSGVSCNNCEMGFYVSSTENGQNTCTSKY